MDGCTISGINSITPGASHAVKSCIKHVRHLPQRARTKPTEQGTKCKQVLQDICLDHCPHRGASPGAVKHRIDKQSCLCSSQQYQQHKGCQHCLIDAATAGCEGYVRDGHKACHHIDQPCQTPGEVNPGIPAASRSAISFRHRLVKTRPV